MGFSASIERSIPYVSGFLALQWPILLIAFAGLFTWSRKERPLRMVAAFGAISLLLLNLYLGGGDPYVGFRRYLVPVLALAVCFIVMSLEPALKIISKWHVGFRPVAMIVILVLIGFQTQKNIQSPFTYVSVTQHNFLERLEVGFRLLWTDPLSGPLENEDLYGYALDHNTWTLNKLGKWLGERSAPGDILATSEVGAVPFRSNLRVIDTFGLIDSHIGRLPGMPGAKSDPEYVFSQSPRFIAFKVNSDCLCGGISADARIFSAWQLEAQYDLVRAFDLNPMLLVFERREEPAFLVAYDFASEFSIDRVRFRDTAGRLSDDPMLAMQLTNNRSAPAWISVEKREKRIAALESLRKKTIPDALETEAFRDWISSWKHMLVHEPLSNEKQAEIHYAVFVPKNGYLDFSVAAAPIPLPTGPESGDGIRFGVRVSVNETDPGKLIFSSHLSPQRRPQDEGWQHHAVDLSPWQDQEVTIIFVSTPGVANDRNHDFGGWGQPQIRISKEGITLR